MNVFKQNDIVECINGGYPVEGKIYTILNKPKTTDDNIHIIGQTCYGDVESFWSDKTQYKQIDKPKNRNGANE